MKRGPLAWKNASAAEADRLAQLGTTRLLIHAVGDTSHRLYAAAVRSFLYDARMHGYPLNTSDELGNGLARYLDDLCYTQKVGFEQGAKTYSGITHLAPEWKDKLPRAARSLMTWQRLANPAEGGPIPVPAIALIITWMVTHGYAYAALATFMAFDGYQRESDWEGICGCDLVIHGSGVPDAAIMLGVGSRGMSTKKGSDHGVVFEDTLLRLWLAELKTDLHPHAALFPMSQVQYRRIWYHALDGCNLKGMGNPHRLRHSGPSRDVFLNRRTLEEVRRRGRWASVKSVQRYTKTHVLLEKSAELNQQQINEGSNTWENLPEVLNKASAGHDDLASLTLRAAARKALKLKCGRGL